MLSRITLCCTFLICKIMLLALYNCWGEKLIEFINWHYLKIFKSCQAHKKCSTSKRKNYCYYLATIKNKSALHREPPGQELLTLLWSLPIPRPVLPFSPEYLGLPYIVMAISADSTVSSLVMKSGQFEMSHTHWLHCTKPNSLLSVFKEAFRLAILVAAHGIEKRHMETSMGSLTNTSEWLKNYANQFGKPCFNFLKNNQ